MTCSNVHHAPFAAGGSAGIDADVCRRLLAAALEYGGDYADLFFEYRATSGLSFEDGITRHAARGVSAGVGVRVLRGDATGSAYVEDFSPEAMTRAARTAARIAQSGRPLAPVALRPIVVPSRYELPSPSIDASGVSKRDLLERASAAALRHDGHVVRVEATFAEEIRELLIATSDGRLVRDVQPLLRLGVRAVAERGARRESGRSGGGGRTSLGYFELRTPEWHGERAAAQALTLLDARPAPAGYLPVVLAPGESGVLLHEAVGHGLEADFNRKGTSNYTGRLGQSVAGPLCTVVDDATVAQSRGSLNVDDEGIEAGRTVLIEDGVLCGYLHDRLSARHFTVAPTGNGRRESFACVPLPRMTNTVLLAGPHDPEEIVRSVRFGVFAQAFGGGQVDISNGDFVFSLTESYLIEDGRIGAPLRGVNLIGNGPETLRGVDMLGSDVTLSDGIWTCGKDGQSVPVGIGCPTVKISGITVGGTEVS